MIRRTEVDGVPTLVAATTGPLRAGLAFRVGRADETLARSGVTHLIEHLALHRLGLTDYHFNGTTGPAVTEFHLQGSGDDIVRFLSGVCESLHHLPLDRLETERAIVRTEWSSRARSPIDTIPLWRHGARDHGVVTYPEYGLGMLRPDDLQRWATYFFTRDNAVLWIAGSDVPAGLRLPLPPGQRIPVPRASSALPTTPAFFTGPEKFVAVDSVVRRRVAATVYTAVLRRALFQSLRQEAGLSYNVDTSYEARGDGQATITALVDALPEKQDAALGGFIDVLAALRVGRIDPADLQAVLTQAHESLSHPEALSGRLPSQAFNLLTGDGYRDDPLAELRAELQTITLADVHAVAQEAAQTALLMAPSGHGAEWGGYAPAPTCSDSAVQGTRYASHSSDVVHLVGGPDGMTMADARDAVTVRYADCAALRIWPDGARQLIGADGIEVNIEPTLFAIGADALRAIDAAVPPHLHIIEPARSPDDIPKPRPKPPKPRPQIRRHPATQFFVLAFGTVFMAVLAVGSLIHLASDEADSRGRIAVLGGLGMTGYFGYAAVKQFRAWRRGVQEQRA